MSWRQQELADLRRARVARLRALGHSVREVAEELSSEGLLNPETGEPYSNATIGIDFAFLDKQWLAEAMKTTHEHKARILAELAEVKRQGWIEGGPKGLMIVLHALARETIMLGLNEPLKVSAVNVNMDFSQLTEDQLARLAAGEDPFAVLGQAPAQVVEGESVRVSSEVSGETLACIPDSSHEENADEEAGPGEGRLGEEEDG